MRKPRALLCCPEGSLTSAASSPHCPGLDLVNKWQPSPWESCRLTANMEQLEEEPAFFTLHKHWGLCSPSRSSKNQRISLPPPQQIARFSHIAPPSPVSPYNLSLSPPIMADVKPLETFPLYLLSVVVALTINTKRLLINNFLKFPNKSHTLWSPIHAWSSHKISYQCGQRHDQ